MEQPQPQPPVGVAASRRRSSRLAAANSRAAGVENEKKPRKRKASDISSSADVAKQHQEESAASRGNEPASGVDFSLCARLGCDLGLPIHSEACKNLEVTYRRLFDKSVVAALKEFNDAHRYNNDSEYELVQKSDLGRPFAFGKIHVNFLAKRKNAPPTAKPVCFFAEVQIGFVKELVKRVLRVCILSGKNCGGGACKACEAYCLVGKVEHPFDGKYCNSYHTIYPSS